MTRLLIPTRNRPTSMRNVLAFLAQFYPNTEVIIADGSTPEYTKRYAQVVAEFREILKIDYRRYNPNLLLFDRLLRVLNSLRDELIIMGADDDFPMMDTLLAGATFLRNNKNYVGAGGSLVHIWLEDGYRMTARFGHTRPIRSRLPLHRRTDLQRAYDYALWSFPTTYGVTRREYAIERYERSKNMLHAGFYDFVVGLRDCIRGEYEGLPDVGFICTRNHTHSYWRWDDPLFFMRRGEDVIELMEKFRDELLALGAVDEKVALTTSQRLIQKRVIELAGWPPHLQAGFMQSELFLDSVIQRQYKIFLGMFEEGNSERARFSERLRFIVRCLEDNAYSGDNKGEAPKYETFPGSRRATR